MNSDFTFSLVDRPPMTEGWHLVVMIAVGAVVVALVHRIVRRKVAIIERNARVRRSSE
jgi:hypothetical protein